MEMKDRIRALRKQNGLTLEEVGKSVGVGKSTVRKWESGDIANMRRDKIAKLAVALHTTPEVLMGWQDSPAPSSAAAPRPIVPIYDALNESGRSSLMLYGRFLLEQDAFRGPDEVPPIQYIRHYLVPAAAGYASPIEGEDYELIELPEDAPRGASFCIDVSGDSMEPYIHDKQTVYVQRDVELHNQDVGVFFVDGSVYIKQLFHAMEGAVILASANPRREAMNKVVYPGGVGSLVCFGKVILPHRLPVPKYV